MASHPFLTCYAVRTKQGWIPGQKKVNQDSYIIEKNFCGVKDLWMLGVCDGHGAQGHLVSNFVKVNLPRILNEKVHQMKSAIALQEYAQA